MSLRHFYDRNRDRLEALLRCHCDAIVHLAGEFIRQQAPRAMGSISQGSHLLPEMTDAQASDAAHLVIREISSGIQNTIFSTAIRSWHHEEYPRGCKKQRLKGAHRKPITRTCARRACCYLEHPEDYRAR